MKLLTKMRLALQVSLGIVISVLLASPAHSQALYDVVHAFPAPEPWSTHLTVGDDGTVYGTTVRGGQWGKGSIYKIASDGTYTLLHAFTGDDGSTPASKLVRGSDGAYYGTTFDSSPNPGSLVRRDGGVFRITSDGAVATLHAFDRRTDGGVPTHLVEALDGSFYGATLTGGAFDHGTLFRVWPDGSFAQIHAFNRVDGFLPSTLVRDEDGTVYGMTVYGGPYGAGTFFKITIDGTFVLLHSLSWTTDGAAPRGSLVQGPDGAFYGITLHGGAFGFGTVYRATSDGVFSVLHSFREIDGAYAEGELTLGADGAFYGTTPHAGANGLGTVFRITLDGAFTVLHAFDGTDGALPRSGVTSGPDGALYGFTQSGEEFGPDTLYRVTEDGMFTVVHQFSAIDGHHPSELVLADDGTMYGATHAGGSQGGGVVFRLRVPRIDRTPPIVSASAGTLPNALDWYHSDVRVVFTCLDDASGSGIPANACPADEWLTHEGSAVTSVARTVTDVAGNTSEPSNTITVRIDKTRPTISAAVTTVPGPTGWFRQDVIVRFTCQDADGSGIPVGGCPADQVLTAEGIAVASTARTVTDAAGNVSAPSNVVVVSIDKTPPSLHPRVTPFFVLLNGDATLTTDAADDLSGLAVESCGPLDVTVVGSQMLYCSAFDGAGNWSVAVASYHVIYRFDGFLQPVNDSTRSTCLGCPMSVFNSGSTITVRFQLKDAQGVVVRSAGLPQWIAPVRVGDTDARINEEDNRDAPTAGTSYRLSGSRYRYSWSTEDVERRSVWRIGVVLDDGQHYVVDVGVR